MAKVGTWGFDEERAPCGDRGLRFHYFTGSVLEEQPPDVSDVLVSRPRSWFLIIWEPLLTKAPGPHLASPYCCYIKTVKFYLRPYVVRPFSNLYRLRDGRLRACKPGGFEEWDSIETRIGWHDILLWQGEEFEFGGGSVVWHGRRWWMRQWARRKNRAAA